MFNKYPIKDCYSFLLYDLSEDSFFQLNYEIRLFILFFSIIINTVALPSGFRAFSFFSFFLLPASFYFFSVFSVFFFYAFFCLLEAIKKKTFFYLVFQKRLPSFTIKFPPILWIWTFFYPLTKENRRSKHTKSKKSFNGKHIRKNPCPSIFTNKSKTPLKNFNYCLSIVSHPK